jgi:hypothetical protein
MKPMSAADYRRNAEAKRAEQATQIVELKSGSVFELRRPNLQAWVLKGRVPQSLLDAGIKAWKEQGKVKDLTDEQKSRQLQMTIDSGAFFVTLVQACTVNPKLVEFPDADKNEIGPDTMLDEDFFEIVSWAMNHEGVAGIDSLQTFREGSEQRTPGTGNDGAELPSETIGVAAN